MECYSQLFGEAPHVKSIWCPLIVSEISYVDGGGFAGLRNCCACPFRVPFGRRHRMVTAKPTAQLPNQPQDLDDYIAAA